MLNLGSCSMLPPHLHPRATNYVVAVHGNTTTYMYEENGARLVTQVLTPGHGTIFPHGSMHMMMNTGACVFDPSISNLLYFQSSLLSRLGPIMHGGSQTTYLAPRPRQKPNKKTCRHEVDPRTSS